MLAALLCAALIASALTGCGTRAATDAAAPAGSAPTGSGGARAATATTVAALPRAHPQAIQPVAGDAAAVSVPAQAGVSVGPPSRSLPEPISEAQVRADLAQSGMTANANQGTVTPQGLAVAPVNAPAAVQAVIAAGNQIARLPYVWGGGHATYEDSGYDCSGSISYVFAAAGLLDQTMTSGELAHWGLPGPGKWITVFANGGHTFMYVAGMRFDTVALAQGGTRWSNRNPTEGTTGFAVRHPPGL
ncbi:MAG TPA: hypothetical protein VFN55_06570 [Solirubrobacteraceae bacterium]|nr:hypothetical protein [Solirubrobacteraceae bacterium]